MYYSIACILWSLFWSWLEHRVPKGVWRREVNSCGQELLSTFGLVSSCLAWKSLPQLQAAKWKLTQNTEGWEVKASRPAKILTSKCLDFTASKSLYIYVECTQNLQSITLQWGSHRFTYLEKYHSPSFLLATWIILFSKWKTKTVQVYITVHMSKY